MCTQMKTEEDWTEDCYIAQAEYPHGDREDLDTFIRQLLKDDSSESFSKSFTFRDSSCSLTQIKRSAAEALKNAAEAFRSLSLFKLTREELAKSTPDPAMHAKTDKATLGTVDGRDGRDGARGQPGAARHARWGTNHLAPSKPRSLNITVVLQLLSERFSATPLRTMWSI